MRILIVVNSGKPMAVEKSLELRRWLDARGIEWGVIESSDIIVDGRFTQQARSCMPDANLVVSFGGDGTLLTAAQLVFQRKVPILGLNFGHLGFLTGADSQDMIASVQGAIDGTLEEDVRCGLDVTIEERDGRLHTYTVLNEVAITRGVTGRMIDYEVSIDGSTLSQVRADGVIVASPSGSTAYSLSAGGPIISPKLSCMVVVALAPHSLVSRALVTGNRETVCILPEERSDKECTVFLDGNRFAMELSPRRVSVTVHDDAVTLLKYNSPGFTKRASKVFFGSMDD